MSIVADLLALVRGPLPGTRKKAHTPAPEPGIPELEAAIAALQAERGAAETAIYGMPAKREALLVEDGTDAAIQALERETDAQHLMIERLDRIEPGLFAKLQALRTEARRQEWLALRDRYVVAATEYHEALLPVLPRLEAMGAIAGEMERAGFYLEANTRPPVPWAGNAMRVEAYRLEVDRYAGIDVQRVVRTSLGKVAASLSPEDQAALFGAPVPTLLENEFRRGGVPVGNLVPEGGE